MMRLATTLAGGGYRSLVAQLSNVWLELVLHDCTYPLSPYAAYRCNLLAYTLDPAPAVRWGKPEPIWDACAWPPGMYMDFTAGPHLVGTAASETGYSSVYAADGSEVELRISADPVGGGQTRAEAWVHGAQVATLTVPLGWDDWRRGIGLTVLANTTGWGTFTLAGPDGWAATLTQGTTSLTRQTGVGSVTVNHYVAGVRAAARSNLLRLPDGRQWLAQRAAGDSDLLALYRRPTPLDDWAEVTAFLDEAVTGPFVAAWAEPTGLMEIRATERVAYSDDLGESWTGQSSAGPSDDRGWTDATRDGAGQRYRVGARYDGTGEAVLAWRGTTQTTVATGADIRAAGDQGSLWLLALALPDGRMEVLASFEAGVWSVRSAGNGWGTPALQSLSGTGLGMPMAAVTAARTGLMVGLRESRVQLLHRAGDDADWAGLVDVSGELASPSPPYVCELPTGELEVGVVGATPRRWRAGQPDGPWTEVA